MLHSQRLDPLPTGSAEASLGRAAIATLAVLLFIASFGWHFLTAELVNDHFWYLYRVMHLVHGELPYRDFDDPGMTLHVYASFVVQRLFGQHLLGETLLCVLFIAAGTSLTFVLSTHISRSVGIGLLSALLAAAAIPRLYNYPKAFLYVFGLLLLWRYVAAPSRRNLLLIAFTTAIAFLFRYDHGAYLAVAAVVTLVSVHWDERRRLLPRRLASYTASVALLLGPYLFFLAANGDVLGHFRRGVQLTSHLVSEVEPRTDSSVGGTSSPIAPELAEVEISVRWAEGVASELRGELERGYGLVSVGMVGDDPRGRTWRYKLADPTPARIAALVEDVRVEDTHGIDRTSREVQADDEQDPGRASAAAWLNLLFRSLPLLAVGLLCAKRLRSSWTGSSVRSWPGEVPQVLGVAALCAVAAPVLLRDDPAPRLADLAGPSAVLGAWLLGQALGAGWPRSAGRQIGALVALLLVVGTAISIWDLGDLGSALERSALLSGRQALLNRGNELVQQLRISPPVDGWAPVGSVGIRALTRYVHACSLPTDRVLISGFAPDVYFYAERRPPRLSGPSRLAIGEAGGALSAQSVPIVVINARDAGGVTRAVRAELETSYYLAAESGFGDPANRYRVLIHRQRIPSGTYQPTSLPCFR